MKPDDFESRLQQQPLRKVPADWRAEILNACGAPSSARHERERRVTEPSNARRSETAWWLVWASPSRAGWAALGAAWLLIVALHLANTRDTVTAPTVSAMAVSPSGWLERGRVMAELMGDTESTEPTFIPRPRSDRRANVLLLCV